MKRFWSGLIGMLLSLPLVAQMNEVECFAHQTMLQQVAKQEN